MKYLKLTVTANSSDTIGLAVALEKIVADLSKKRLSGQFQIGENKGEHCGYEVTKVESKTVTESRKKKPKKNRSDLERVIGKAPAAYG